MDIIGAQRYFSVPESSSDEGNKITTSERPGHSLFSLGTVIIYVWGGGRRENGVSKMLTETPTHNTNKKRCHEPPHAKSA